MDKAHELAAQGAVEKTLVLARTQTKGRGRRGKFWKSPEGNLYMSVILRPQEPLITDDAVVPFMLSRGRNLSK